jgi:hypothetical protein
LQPQKTAERGSGASGEGQGWHGHTAGWVCPGRGLRGRLEAAGVRRGATATSAGARAGGCEGKRGVAVGRMLITGGAGRGPGRCGPSFLVSPAPTSRKSRMPFGELLSKVSRWLLLKQNSATNLSSGAVTSGQPAHASRHLQGAVGAPGAGGAAFTAWTARRHRFDLRIVARGLHLG